MIELCRDSDMIGNIFSYIGNYKFITPYIYANIERYGVESPQMKVWLDYQDSKITGVYAKYFDCLHFFTIEGESYPIQPFLNLVEAERPKVIMVQDRFGVRIEKFLQVGYQVNKNNLLDLQVEKNGVPHSDVEIVRRNDLSQIADLMMADSEFINVYQKDRLLAQFEERYDSGFSRFFVIRRDERIAALYSTYGETRDFVILSGLLVHPQYRRLGLAHMIMQHAAQVMKEGKREAITFVNQNNTASLRLHEKFGAVPLSIMYKFVEKV